MFYKHNMRGILLSVVSVFYLQSMVQASVITELEEEEDFEELYRNKRIEGGDILEDIRSWPWLANLHGKFCSGWWIFSTCTHVYCGASVINDRWVLTAAHCMDHPDAMTANKWHVKVGEATFEKDLATRFYEWLRRLFGDRRAYQKIHGERVIVHPQADGWLNDIALIKLAAQIPLERDDIGPVTLPPQLTDKSWPQDGAQCVVKGWGCTVKGGGVSDKARVVKLYKTEDATCSAFWGQGQASFTDTRLCAGKDNSESAKGICKGDSGGPLVCMRDNEWVQAGIASFNSPSNPGLSPSGFTRVSYYSHWINETIKNN